MPTYSMKREWVLQNMTEDARIQCTNDINPQPLHLKNNLKIKHVTWQARL